MKRGVAHLIFPSVCLIMVVIARLLLYLRYMVKRCFTYVLSILFGLGPMLVSAIIALLIVEAVGHWAAYPVAVVICLYGAKLGISTFKSAIKMGPWDLYCSIYASPDVDNLAPARDPSKVLIDHLIERDTK